MDLRPEERRQRRVIPSERGLRGSQLASEIGRLLTLAAVHDSQAHGRDHGCGSNKPGKHSSTRLGWPRSCDNRTRRGGRNWPNLSRVAQNALAQCVGPRIGAGGYRVGKRTRYLSVRRNFRLALLTAGEVRLEDSALLAVERIQRVRRRRFDQFLVRHSRFSTWSLPNDARSCPATRPPSTAGGIGTPALSRSPSLQFSYAPPTPSGLV